MSCIIAIYRHVLIARTRLQAYWGSGWHNIPHYYMLISTALPSSTDDITFNVFVCFCTPLLPYPEMGVVIKYNLFQLKHHKRFLFLPYKMIASIIQLWEVFCNFNWQYKTAWTFVDSPNGNSRSYLNFCTFWQRSEALIDMQRLIRQDV